MTDIIPTSWHYIGGKLYFARRIDDFITDPDLAGSYNHGSDTDDAVHCPDCNSYDTCCLAVKHPTYPGCWYCKNCNLVWKFNCVFCPACLRFPVKSDEGKLTCWWCGQVWDEDILEQIFTIGDEYSEADFNTEKGANK